MNATGVVVEYNPFHNGHKFHLDESKLVTEADLVVAVMSGNFLQRGEPALVSKWARTKMALAQGVDIVLELPYVYATQHAEVFAKGAISILNQLGIQSLCFGSEAGDINEFYSLLTFINQQNTTYNIYIHEKLKKGYSYPKALALAFKELNNHEQILDLSLPNNILGYHYIKAIHEQAANIKPYTIMRKNTHYHDKEIPTHSIASATSIREKLVNQNGDLSSIRHVVPETTYHELINFSEQYESFQNWERLFPYLKFKIMTSSLSQLAEIYEAEEGLENRLVSSIKEATSFLDMMKKMKTKRYTWTRLQRFCLHALTNTTKEEMKHVNENCPYIRVIGMSITGREYMNQRKKQLDVPLVSTVSKTKHPFLEIENRSTFCYSLGYNSKIQSKILREEFAQPPIIV